MTISRKEILLLMIYSPVEGREANVPIRGRTRLAKMMFLFRKEVWPTFKFDKVIPEEMLPEFVPWKFGPFSKDVFADVEFLQNVEFLSETTGSGPAHPEEALELSYWSGTADPTLADSESSIGEYSEEVFKLSSDGMQYVKEKRLWDDLSDQQQSALVEFKRKLVNAPLYAILKYVYDNYPEMTNKSEIRDRLLSRVH